MPQVIRFANTASNAALAAMFAIAVALLLAVGIGSVTGQYRTVTVLTGSMRPAMDPGDVVVERPISPTSVRVGDVITFHPPDEPQVLVTHRVVAIGDDNGQVFVQTKGDANNTADAWNAVLPSSQPVWVKAVTIPKVGYVVVWVRNGTLLKMLVFAVPILLLGSFLRSLWRPTDEQACAT